MPTPRQTLKQWFSRGKKPTALQFAAWIDSFWHKAEDTIQIADINGLPQTLNKKTDVGHTHDATDIRNLPTTQVDTVIDPVSTNPVENQAIAAALQNKANTEHLHHISDTTGLQSALDNKADLTHRHEIGEIANLGETLNDKSDIGHTHTASDIDDFQNRVVELIDEFRPQTDPEPDIQEVVYVADAAALEQIAEPSESTLYITEDTGYFYKYRDGEFELIEDNEDDGTIYCNGSFTNLDNLLKQYTRTGSYDVVLIQTSNQIATYRFVCSANSSKISQTLTKDQRDGTSANTRTRTGTIRTVNNEQVITWSGWTVRTPVYQETLDKSLSSTSNNAVKNSVIKAALDNKADLNHSHRTEYATANHGHAISDVTGLQTALDGKQQAGNYLTRHQDISGKADKVVNPTAGNFASLDNDGNLVDSGNNAEDFLTQHQLKTINNQSIVGSGDITIQGGSDDRYIECEAYYTYDEDTDPDHEHRKVVFTRTDGGTPFDDLQEGQYYGVCDCRLITSQGISSVKLSGFLTVHDSTVLDTTDPNPTYVILRIQSAYTFLPDFDSISVNRLKFHIMSRVAMVFGNRVVWMSDWEEKYSEDMDITNLALWSKINPFAPAKLAVGEMSISPDTYLPSTCPTEWNEWTPTFVNSNPDYVAGKQSISVYIAGNTSRIPGEFIQAYDADNSVVVQIVKVFGADFGRTDLKCSRSCDNSGQWTQWTQWTHVQNT